MRLPDKMVLERDIAVRARRYASSGGFVFLALVVVAVVDVPTKARTIGFEDQVGILISDKVSSDELASVL